MPLKKIRRPATKAKCRKNVSENISMLMREEGRPQKQAIAIALSHARRMGCRIPDTRKGRAGGDEKAAQLERAHELGFAAGHEVLTRHGRALYESNLSNLTRVKGDAWDRAYTEGYRHAGGPPRSPYGRYGPDAGIPTVRVRGRTSGQLVYEVNNLRGETIWSGSALDPTDAKKKASAETGVDPRNIGGVRSYAVEDDTKTFLVVYGAKATSIPYKIEAQAVREARNLSRPKSYGGEVVVLERSPDGLHLREVGRANRGTFVRTKRTGRNAGWFLAGAIAGYGAAFALLHQAKAPVGGKA